MFSSIASAINEKVSQIMINQLNQYIEKNQIVSTATREPRYRSTKVIKEDMYFEVDEVELEKLRLELIDAQEYEVLDFDISEYPKEEYPEMYI
jgi:hypothetical protein